MCVCVCVYVCVCVCVCVCGCVCMCVCDLGESKNVNLTNKHFIRMLRLVCLFEELNIISPHNIELYHSFNYSVNYRPL